MSLPALYAQPSSPDEWRRWAFNHAAEHYQTADLINARLNTPLTLVTTAETTTGNKILEFAAVPSTIVNGYISTAVTDSTNAVIPDGTIINAISSTEVELSNEVTGNVLDGDSIVFTPSSYVALPLFQLNPLDPNDIGIWLYWHQEMHNDANAALNTSGYDLLALDWQDPDELAEWLRLNGDEHVRWDGALNGG